MSFSIKIPDATFTKFVSTAMPAIVLEAKVYSLYGINEASSTANAVGTKAPLTVIGSPTYGANYASLTNLIGFESADAASGTPFTHISVAEFVSGVPGYCGNWKQAAVTQSLLYTNVGDTKLAVDGEGRGQVAAATSGFRFNAASYNGATAKVYTGVGGVLTSASSAYAGLGAVEKFRVGASGFSIAGAFKAAATLTFGRVLTDSEITEVYVFLAGVMSKRGITLS
jgi:hypothetical protein